MTTASTAPDTAPDTAAAAQPSTRPIPARTTLATRIAVLSIGIAVVTAILAGALALGLIRTAGESDARSKLAKLAIVAQTSEDAAGSPAAERRLRRALTLLNVQVATISSNGAITADAPLARTAVTPADVTTLLGGQAISIRRTVAGHVVYVEGQPTRSGAVVLVERRADATALGDRAARRVLLALLIAAAIATVLGLVVAWRMSRPLKRTAQAAHALAAGRRDVTVSPEGPAEVAEVAVAVNTLAGALSVSEGRQREFLMSVSHELRTPLTAISGYAESLAEGVVPADQAAAVGAVMLGEARRLDRLVSDLLDLARLDAQDFRIEFADVDVVAMAHDAARVWQTRCRSAGVAFRLEAPPYPITIRTDSARLRQVVDGLLENALRVTAEGAPVVLAVRPGPSTGGASNVTVEVRDGGPGLTDADLAVAFDRSALYRRYQGVRQVGTGLGLAIVHGLMSRLGGTIEAGHAPEGGARFTAHLPAGA